MSNIWVGGISFGAGFSSGFQNAGLEPLLFEIVPQQVTVISTTNISVSVDESYLLLNIYETQASVSTNIITEETAIVLSTSAANIEISCITEPLELELILEVNNISIIANANIITENTDFSLLLQQPIAIAGAVAIIQPITCIMTLEDVSVTGTANIQTGESVFISVPYSPTTSISITANTSGLNIITTLYDISTGIITSVFVSEAIVVINNDYEVEAGYYIPNWKECGALDNPFWDKSSECRTNESNLYDCITTDAYNKFGVPAIWYQVDYSTNNEQILGEDNDRIITRNFAVQYYTENLPADDKLWSKWGIEGMDRFHIYITKTHFAGASQYDIYGNFVEESQRPKPGDIIKSTHNNVYYDVIEVKDRIEMFMQRSHTWDITVRPMINNHYSISDELSNDDIVNHIEVDDILAQNAIINIEKEKVLYKSSPDIDPFGLL